MRNWRSEALCGSAATPIPPWVGVCKNAESAISIAPEDVPCSAAGVLIAMGSYIEWCGGISSSSLNEPLKFGLSMLFDVGKVTAALMAVSPRMPTRTATSFVPDSTFSRYGGAATLMPTGSRWNRELMSNQKLIYKIISWSAENSPEVDTRPEWAICLIQLNRQMGGQIWWTIERIDASLGGSRSICMRHCGFQQSY